MTSHDSRTETLMLGAIMCAALAPLACSSTSGGESPNERTTDQVTQAWHTHSPGKGYNLHLQRELRFNPIQPGADVDRGRARFGLAPDGNSEDKTQALFEGPSIAFGGTVVSNTRTCATCHRGNSNALGLPSQLPISASVPLTDALFTGIDADAQGDPDAMHNLDELGLFKYRPNRFNLARSQSDPYRRVFFWRKSIKLVNTGLNHGFLNDGRGRVMFETARGAVFSHTQSSDERFDDLITLGDMNDMEAFQFLDTFSDPRLAALRDPNHPLFNTLARDPFFTVPISTSAQRRGSRVFAQNCMSCHSTPNVFNDVWNVEPLGNDARPVTDPAFAPSVGRAFDIGISQRNKHHLRFSESLGGGQFAPIVIPLANEDGTTRELPVTFDIGLAATTGRSIDVGRFKVPQLRRLQDVAPYFHDNSAASIEEVVDYFNSARYNGSRDGRRYPIHLSWSERHDLIEFLKIL